MKKHFQKIVIAAILMLAAIFAVGYYRSMQQKDQNVIYLAVVGPLETTRGEAMVNGTQLYLDQINPTLNGKRIEILPYDDQNDVALAEQRAREIVQDPKSPLIVLGHRGSDQALKGGVIYKQYQIPAITASAPSPSVTKDNEWYFSVIIENTSQGHFIAEYARDVLKYENISVIYQDNDYGGTLGKAVLDQARKLNMNIAYQIGYKNVSDKQERWSQFPQIISDVLTLDDPGIVILAVGDEDGAQLVKGFRDNSLELPIMEALITQTFNDSINELTHNNRSTYLQNLWTTQHLLYDTGNKIAQDFYNTYYAKYGEYPDAAAAAYYDAAMVAVRAIRDTQVDGKNPAQDRQKLRDYLSGLTKLNPDLRGATGYIYFGSNRNAIKPVPIGIYDRGELISAPIQLHAIPNVELIPDLQGEVNTGNVLKIDNNYFYKTQVVYTGIDLNKISDLDMKNSTFTADFYLWFRYQGDFDESNVEFVNAVSPITLDKPIAEDTYKGETYHAYRVKAEFKGDFNFRAYPFDQQTLNISIRNRNLRREQLTFVRDNLRLLPNQALIEQLNRAVIDGWEATDVKVYSDILRSDSTLGNPRLSNAGIEYSIFNVDTNIKRDAVNFSIKNLFPIVAVLVLAYLAFFIPASEFGMRVSLGINAIMTTAFFSLKISSDLPSIGYVVALEYIFFATYSLAILVIVLAIFIYLAVKQKDGAEKQKGDSEQKRSEAEKQNNKVEKELHEAAIKNHEANEQRHLKRIQAILWTGRILFPLGLLLTGYLISRII